MSAAVAPTSAGWALAGASAALAASSMFGVPFGNASAHPGQVVPRLEPAGRRVVVGAEARLAGALHQARRTSPVSGPRAGVARRWPCAVDSPRSKPASVMSGSRWAWRIGWRTSPARVEHARRGVVGARPLGLLGEDERLRVLLEQLAADDEHEDPAGRPAGWCVAQRALPPSIARCPRGPGAASASRVSQKTLNDVPRWSVGYSRHSSSAMNAWLARPGTTR